MTTEETHPLVLVSSQLTGAEEWYCPACGHRALKTWLAGERWTVLVEGDHSRHSHPVDSHLPQTLHPLNNSTLAPWLDWIGQFDFDQLKDDSSEFLS